MVQCKNKQFIYSYLINFIIIFWYIYQIKMLEKFWWSLSSTYQYIKLSATASQTKWLVVTCRAGNATSEWLLEMDGKGVSHWKWEGTGVSWKLQMPVQGVQGGRQVSMSGKLSWPAIEPRQVMAATQQQPEVSSEQKHKGQIHKNTQKTMTRSNNCG